MSEEHEKQSREPAVLENLLYIRIENDIYLKDGLKEWLKKKEDEN